MRLIKHFFLFFILTILGTAKGHAIVTSGYEAVRVNLTMQVGGSIRLTPLSDSKVSTGDFTGGGGGILSDASAFKLSSTKSSVYGRYVNGNASHDSYTYSLKALKEGSYTFSAWVRYQTLTTSGTIPVTYYIEVKPKPVVTKIDIPSTLIVKKGDTYTFSPVILEEGAATTLTWTSSNTTVATITSAGVVTAKAAGETDITCTASNGVKATCKLTVKVDPILATKVSLNYSSKTLYIGDTYKLIATVSPTNTTDSSISWTSSKASVATVDENGNVKGIAEGTATITATTKDGSNQSASCTFTVKKNSSGGTGTTPTYHYDVNGDGKVDIKDVTDLVNYIIK